MRSIKESSPVTVGNVISSIEQHEPWWTSFNNLSTQDTSPGQLISQALETYQELEKTACQPLNDRLSTINTGNLKLLWTISGPGSYFSAEKNDRFRDQRWARWFDRKRINETFRIARQVARQNGSGQLPDAFKAGDADLIRGPDILYNGNPQENEAFSEALRVPWLRIPADYRYPAEKVHVIDANVGKSTEQSGRFNTVDQVKSFRIPLPLNLNTDDEIGIVAHAPQLTRILYILERFRHVIPEGVGVRMFPLPAPPESLPDYLIQEIRAIVYYRYFADPPTAGDIPYPFKK